MLIENDVQYDMGFTVADWYLAGDGHMFFDMNKEVWFDLSVILLFNHYCSIWIFDKNIKRVLFFLEHHNFS